MSVIKNYIQTCLDFYRIGKRKSSPILVTEHWAQSWSCCTGNQPAGDFLSHPAAVGCHNFPPGLRSPSRPRNVAILQPVPNYTAWWTTCPRLLRSFVPVGIEPTTYWSQVQHLTAMPQHHMQDGRNSIWQIHILCNICFLFSISYFNVHSINHCL